jgi:hypothetical protein
MQYVCSPYGLPPQVPRPTAPGDPSTPCHDASQVDLSFLFKSDFKFLNLSHSFLLQSSQTGQAPVMLWGGSLAVWQPPTWPPQPPAEFWSPPLPHFPGFWHQPPPGQSCSTPPPTDAMDTNTWRASPALGNASVDGTAATSFLASNSKT